MRVLRVAGTSLPVTWERAVMACVEMGCSISTQYDREGDPPSKDCMMTMVVNDPLREPMIHSFMPGGPSDLQEYCMEVIDGIHDHWISKKVGDNCWSYTYHQRIADQIEIMLKQLKEAPFTRRAQAVALHVIEDNLLDDPPCLQRVWIRIFGEEMTMHTYWRSRDALKAAFMNAFVFILWGKKIAKTLGVRFVQYVDTSDSFHVYGKDLEDYRNKFQPGKYFYYRGASEESPWKPMMEGYTEEIYEKLHRQDENRRGQEEKENG